MTVTNAVQIRRFIAENAHRMIFSNIQDKDILKLRPRVVNRDIMEDKKKQWSNWHKEQSKAEIKLQE